FHLAYGTYLGIAAAGMLVLAACATPRRDHLGLSPGLAATLLAALGLLAALLLPWERLNGWTGIGLTLAPGAAAGALVTLAPLIYRRAELPLIGVAVLLATGGAFSVLDFPAGRAYGAWVGLAVATAFAVIAAVLGRPKGSRVPP